MILARSLEAGGAERQIVLLARELRRRGIGCTVVLFYGGGPMHEALLSEGVPCAVVGKRGRWDLLGFGIALVRTLRRLEPEVVYSFLVVPNVVIALLRPLLRGTRLVWGVRASRMELNRYDWLARAAFTASVVLSRVPQRIVANSEAGRSDHVAAGYPFPRIVVVPNGIDVACFVRKPVEGAALRRAWGMPEAVPLVGMVARLDPKKGHDVFVEAARLLTTEGVGARFVCVGGGPAERAAALEQAIVDAGLAGVAAWVGHHDDMPAVYSALDVLCLPSRFGEGFPNVLGEALSCGTPVVSTEVGDAALIVDGAGVVVRPGSPVAVAQAIRRVLQESARDPRGVQKRAREAAVRFSVDAMVDATLAALDLRS